MKPRVLLVSHIYLESRYHDKLRYLAREVDLRVIGPARFSSAYGAMTAPNVSCQDYEFVAARCWFPLWRRTSTRWVLSPMDLGVRAFQPDIIHVENELTSFVLFQAIAARRLLAPRARLIVFIWANQPSNLPFARLLSVVARMAARGADFLLVGSKASELLLREKGIDARRIAVLPAVGVDASFHGISTETGRRVTRARLGIAADEIVVGFVGRLVEEKGLTDLAKAFEALRARRPQDKVRLLLVGNGPMREWLVRQPNVTVATPAPNEQVAPYYCAMDMMVLPSRTTASWSEQFGRVLVEAMAVGVPLIGSSSGAIPEVIGDAGIVVPEAAPDALAGAIEKLVGAPGLVRTLTERAKVRVAQRFDNAAIAAETARVYRSVLNCSPGRSSTPLRGG